jgi:hypothetical protein
VKNVLRSVSEGSAVAVTCLTVTEADTDAEGDADGLGDGVPTLNEQPAVKTEASKTTPINKMTDLLLIESTTL